MIRTIEKASRAWKGLQVLALGSAVMGVVVLSADDQDVRSFARGALVLAGVLWVSAQIGAWWQDD